MSQQYRKQTQIYSITSFSQSEYVFPMHGYVCVCERARARPSQRIASQKLMPLNLRTRKSISGARGTRTTLME